MAIYIFLLQFRLVTLIFLLLNCADGHNPTKLLFRKPPFFNKVKQFTSEYSDINFRKVFLNMKPFIPHATIGLTVVSCLANSLSFEIRDKVNITNTTNTTNTSYNYEDSIIFSNNDYDYGDSDSDADGVIDITNYKMKLHPDVITNVSVKMKVRMIETELEIGVCNCSYRANNIHEIDIEKGEILTIISKEENIWCNGVNSNGEWGIFPTKNVVFINKPK